MARRSKLRERRSSRGARGIDKRESAEAAFDGILPKKDSAADWYLLAKGIAHRLGRWGLVDLILWRRGGIPPHTKNS